MSDHPSPKDMLALAKRNLTLLCKIDGSRKRIRAADVARSITNIVDQIMYGSVEEPDEAFAILCRLVASDMKVLYEMDDSNGTVSDVYRGHVLKAALHIVQRCTDVKQLQRSFMKALEHDEFGNIQRFVDVVGSHVPVNVIEYAYSELDKRERAPFQAGSFRYDTSLELQKRLLVVLGDADRYEALCTENGDVHLTDYIALIHLYCDKRQYDAAERWRAKLSANEFYYKQDEAIEATARLFQESGRANEAHAVLRKAFLELPTDDTYAMLLKSAGEEYALDAVHSLYLNTLTSQENPSFDIAFLVGHGYAHQVEQYVVTILNTTDGITHYAEWPFVAQSLEQQGFLIGATAAYRLLLNDILNKTRYKAYGIGIRYLYNLSTIAYEISEWHDIQPHEEYIQFLRAKHYLKKAFWREWDE